MLTHKIVRLCLFLEFKLMLLNIALLFELHVTGMLYQITLYKHPHYKCSVAAFILIIIISLLHL